MYIKTTFERPFGSSEPHIGGFEDSELIYDSEDELIEIFITEWAYNGFGLQATAIDDYTENDIELDASTIWTKDQLVVIENIVDSGAYTEDQLIDTLTFLLI